nr:alpha/beta hydrolase-fold protein [Bacillus altitudinis]
MAQWSKPSVYSQEDLKKQVSHLLSLLELAIKQKNPIIRLGIMISLLPPLMHTYGGASTFFSFLEKTVKPYIEQRFPINQSRQTLFGHSLGGLFVLHTLFEHPDAYQTYIAGSPSIHWNKKLFLEKEHQFTNYIRQVPMDVRLLVGVGELEKHHPCQMNDHAHSLANRMLPLSPYGLHTAYHEFPEEGHTSVLPVLMNYAFRFALYHDDPLTTTDMKKS